MMVQAEMDGLSGEGKRLRLSGVLVPSVWDDKGRIERVSIATHDEREFLILPDAMGVKAARMVRQEVVLEGCLESGPDGRVLRVVSISPAA